MASSGRPPHHPESSTRCGPPCTRTVRPVAAGVPPLHALRSATIEPATALGIAEEVGAIGRDKREDLVLIDIDRAI